MRKIIMALCIVLALLTAVLTPLQLAAGSKQKYISEMKLAYGAEERDSLAINGYTVLDGNLNKGNSVEVYLCYKTTENADEAIRDISMMNMTGNYSTAKFEDIIEQKKESINATAYELMTAIDEFADCYKANTKSAQTAYKILNIMTDDDTGKGLGDLFVGGVTAEQLETILLQANSRLLGNIYYAISIGCSRDTSGKTFLNTLENKSIDDNYPDELYFVAVSVAEECVSMNEMMQFFDEAWNAAFARETGSYDDDTAEKIFADYLSEHKDIYDDKAEAITLAYAVYRATKDVQYADSGLTVYEFLIQNADEFDEETCMPLASALSDGQYGIMSSVGLFVELAQASYSDSALDNAYNEFRNTVTEQGLDTVSIYLGVDRSIYCDGISVAMTTDAATESYANENYEWVSYKNEVHAAAQTVWNIALIGMSVFLVGTIASFIGLAIFYTGTTNAGLTLGQFMEAFFFGTISNEMTAGTTVFTISGAVITKVFFILLIAAALVCIGALIFTVCSDAFVKKREFVSYKYDTIPAIMIDFIDYDSVQGEYVYYYAVTTYESIPADLNGWDNKTNRYWNALYVSYDSRLGSPITELSIGTLSEAPSGMTAVHDFEKGVEGIKSAVNLNQSSKAQDTSIYLYYTAYNANTQTGSAFSTGSGMASIVGAFMFGLAISGGTVYAMTKKKKAEENA